MRPFALSDWLLTHSRLLKGRTLDEWLHLLESLPSWSSLRWSVYFMRADIISIVIAMMIIALSLRSLCKLLLVTWIVNIGLVVVEWLGAIIAGTCCPGGFRWRRESLVHTRIRDEICMRLRADWETNVSDVRPLLDLRSLGLLGETKLVWVWHHHGWGNISSCLRLTHGKMATKLLLIRIEELTQVRAPRTYSHHIFLLWGRWLVLSQRYLLILDSHGTSLGFLHLLVWSRVR